MASGIFLYFLASNFGVPGYPSELHSVKRQNKGMSMLGSNYGYVRTTGNYASVPILVTDRFSLFIGLSNHTPA